MDDTVTSVEKHGTKSVADQADVCKLLAKACDERFEVQWDNTAKVKPRKCNSRYHSLGLDLLK